MAVGMISVLHPTKDIRDPSFKKGSLVNPITVFPKPWTATILGGTTSRVKDALSRIKSKTMVVGIDTDVLFPVEEQKFLSEHIPNAQLAIIKSNYGHDGFLVETKQLNRFFKTYFFDKE